MVFEMDFRALQQNIQIKHSKQGITQIINVRESREMCSSVHSPFTRSTGRGQMRARVTQQWPHTSTNTLCCGLEVISTLGDETLVSLSEMLTPKKIIFSYGVIQSYLKSQHKSALYYTFQHVGQDGETLWTHSHLTLDIKNVLNN